MSQLPYLNHEIEAVRRHIAELEKKLSDSSAKVPGMPDCEDVYRKPNIIAEIADCKVIEQARMVQCIHEYNRLCRYIAGVDDGIMRQILLLRYIDGFTWYQVAVHVGGGNTTDSVRQAHNRFLKLRRG